VNLESKYNVPRSCLAESHTSHASWRFRAHLESGRIATIGILGVVFRRHEKPVGPQIMATAPELTTKVATLEERVANHIRFFWVVVGAGFLWLSGITGLLIRTNENISAIPIRISENLTAQAKQYAQAGNHQAALRSVELAQATVNSAAEEGVKAEPDFFQQEISTLNAINGRTPELLTQINNLRFALAAYRSRLTPKPSLPHETKQVVGDTAQLPNEPGILLLQVSWLPGPGVTIISDGRTVLDGTKLSGDILIPPSRSVDDNHILVQGMILMNASQTLDGITWKNVVFVNVHIKYLNGAIALENVRFVNCTFDLPDSQDGARIAEYATLQNNSLRIG
jgi:hypothetical protein